MAPAGRPFGRRFRPYDQPRTLRIDGGDRGLSKESPVATNTKKQYLGAMHYFTLPVAVLLTLFLPNISHSYPPLWIQSNPYSTSPRDGRERDQLDAFFPSNILFFWLVLETRLVVPCTLNWPKRSSAGPRYTCVSKRRTNDALSGQSNRFFHNPSTA